MAFLVSTMCKFNLNCHKLYFNSTRTVLTNYKKCRFKKNYVYLVNFRFLYSSKFPRIFIKDSVCEKQPFMSSYYFQVMRKNLKTRSHKLVFKPSVKCKEKKLSHTSLIESLQKCKLIEEQIKVFVSLVKLPDDDIHYRYDICQNVEKIVQPYFPFSSICLIGSSVNGLGIKGCDVDLSLRISNITPNEHSAVENSFPDEKSEAEVPVNEVKESRKKLLTIKKTLQNLKFGEPLTVIPGRCPILNFFVENISCDLAVNNNSAVHSTNLMLLCGKLDERVIPLIQIIIYWGKQSKLIGGPGKFKTYAIFLMVVYFLQTRNPAVLPFVETILEKTEFLKNLENWSYDVTKYLGKFKKSENIQTVEELLREFFFFYGNYDFSHIICPINGSSIDSKLFTAEVEYNNFEMNTICIQDPLCLKLNVTTGVTWKNCANFLKAIILIWEKYQDQSCWIPGSHDWGLTSLINSKFTYDNLKNIQEFSIDLPFASTVIDNFMHKNIATLFDEAANNVKYILNYCLHFQCYLVHDINSNYFEFPQSLRTIIVNQLLRTHDTDCSEVKDFVFPTDNLKDNQYPRLITRYICATKDTWSGRSTFISLYDSAKNMFDNEHKISEKLELERENNEKEIFYFLCECYGAYVENSICLQIKFKPLNNDRFIPKLAVFLKEYIPKLMDKVSYESQVKKEEIK